MKGHETAVASTDNLNKSPTFGGAEPGDSKFSKAPSWSGFIASAFSVFETYSDSSACEKKAVHSRHNGWAAAVKRVMTGGAMRRIQERVLGSGKTGVSNSTSDIWLLGVCYKLSHDESSGEVVSGSGLAAFKQDFSSRILMTYRKGFEPIGDSKFTSDINWGCMLRSSQMLIAQALLFHRLGRSWRKPVNTPFEQEYIEILELFCDSAATAFSIHSLIQAGKSYGLAAGSWVGPYATCRSWESLTHSKKKEIGLNYKSLSIVVYIVSGSEDGERGGAPVVCIEDVLKKSLEFSQGQADWTPVLLLVPLVLGLEKVNPRYLPSLRATFTFPQSLGILGGKPGASTYIVGVQEENAFYLDPHNVQPVANVSKDNLNVDTSSYHCDLIRYIPLELIDPSLAIGFYCRDKDDFDDFCSRASKLAEESNGAPLFTVAQTHNLPVPVTTNDKIDDGSRVGDNESLGVPMNDLEDCAQEDDWQLL